jgi:hypothetical protein
MLEPRCTFARDCVPDVLFTNNFHSGATLAVSWTSCPTSPSRMALTKRFIVRITSTRVRMHEMNELNAQLVSNACRCIVILVCEGFSDQPGINHSPIPDITIHIPELYPPSLNGLLLINMQLRSCGFCRCIHTTRVSAGTSGIWPNPDNSQWRIEAILSLNSCTLT